MENIPYRVFALGEYTEDEEPLDFSIYTLVGLQEEDLKPGIKQTLDNLLEEALLGISDLQYHHHSSLEKEYYTGKLMSSRFGGFSK